MGCLDYNYTINAYDYDASYAEDYDELIKFKNNFIDLSGIKSFLPISSSYKLNGIGFQQHKKLLKEFEVKTYDFSNFYDDSCLNLNKIVNPIPVKVICNEVLDMDDKAYDTKLFREAYESILQDAQDISTVETKNFIEHCEAVYKMSSKDFIEIYKKKNGEVNVEQQLWAMIIRNQSELDT